MQQRTEILADLIRQKLSTLSANDKLLAEMIRQKLTNYAPRSPWLQAQFNLNPAPTVVRRVFGI